MNPETENPSERSVKFRARLARPPNSPVAFCAASWNAMNPTPTSGALAKSAGNPGNATGRIAPIAISAEPTRIGQRVPMRSDTRPAATESSIGSSAYSDISTPTVNGEAPIDSASSDTMTRLPASTEWFAIPSRINKASVRVARASPTVTWVPRRLGGAARGCHARTRHGARRWARRASDRLGAQSRRQPVDDPCGRMRLGSAITDAIVKP